jgi:hypothetical protein
MLFATPQGIVEDETRSEGEKKWKKKVGKNKKTTTFFADGYYKRQLCARRRKKIYDANYFLPLGRMEEDRRAHLLSHKSP